MRRIIQRVVTVVTTTTWTIAWEKEPGDPDNLATSAAGTGAGSLETGKMSKQTDESSRETYPYSSDNERKSKS